MLHEKAEKREPTNNRPKGSNNRSITKNITTHLNHLAKRGETGPVGGRENEKGTAFRGKAPKQGTLWQKQTHQPGKPGRLKAKLQNRAE